MSTQQTLSSALPHQLTNNLPAQFIDPTQAQLDAAAMEGVPGTSGANKRPAARTRCVALSPTGRTWAAATTEGVVLYGTDDDLVRAHGVHTACWFQMCCCAPMSHLLMRR